MTDAATRARVSMAAAAARVERDRVAAEAERTREIGPDRLAVAELLGAKPSEIAEVTVARGGDVVARSDRNVVDVGAGDVIVTYAGPTPRVIIVSPDRPDGAGQFGVLVLDPPRYPGSAPVFVPRPSEGGSD